MENKNYFEILNNINVQDKVEEKNGMNYLSWAYAWGEIKKIYPNANYKIYERESEFGPVNYFTDGSTCWVKTGVTVNDIEHIEELPVLDYKFKSIALENITSFDVNKTIQRSLTKALARHGLGLYLYAGEDLPEEEKTKQQTTPKQVNSTQKTVTKATPEQISRIKELFTTEEVVTALELVKKEKLEDLTLLEANSLISKRSENK